MKSIEPRILHQGVAAQHRGVPHLAMSLLVAGVMIAGCDGGMEIAAPGPEGQGPATATSQAAVSDADRVDLLMKRHMARLDFTPSGDVSGRLADHLGSPLAGVSVRLGAHVAITDVAGEFSLQDVDLGNQVVTFEHPDYVLTQRHVNVRPGEDNRLDARVMARADAHRISAGVQAEVQEGPFTLTFEPRDLALDDGSTPSGDIDVVVSAIVPGQPGHIDAAPARLEGVFADGRRVGLVSYGMLEVEMFQGNQRVHVARGESVTVALNLGEQSSMQVGEAIPMWHHDTRLGLWAREGELVASVAKRDDVLVAVAELPHFSAWNYDVVADASCAVLSVPATYEVQRIQVVSTNSSGAPDGKWELESDCSTRSERGSACVTDIPSRSGVYFKIQAQTSGGSWCDLEIALDRTERTTFSGNNIRDWLTSRGLTVGSWCGQAQPEIGPGVYLNGVYQLGSFPATLPANHVRFGQARSTCAGLGVNAASLSDSGYANMASNELSTSYSNDYDRDGTADKSDRCVAASTTQADGNGNNIGDDCEPWCYVPSWDPYADWYDYDGDGVDDLCDSSVHAYNPSQYVAPSGGGGGGPGPGPSPCPMIAGAGNGVYLPDCPMPQTAVDERSGR